MKKLLYKELKLVVSPLTPLFLLFSFMVLIPGYPILMGAFFVSFGIFQSYQTVRDNNDILYSSLLPIKKTETVTSKFAVAILDESAGFILMALLTVLRMTVLSDASVYVTNVMMKADCIFLGFVLLIFGEFNFIFLGGFFKTSYYFGKPFVLFIIASMLTVGVGETLHHLPHFPEDSTSLQIGALISGIVIYALLTLISLKISQKRFELTDIM